MKKPSPWKDGKGEKTKHHVSSSFPDKHPNYTHVVQPLIIFSYEKSNAMPAENINIAFGNAGMNSVT